MFCKNCGNEIEDGKNFCTNCGTAVGETAPPAQPSYYNMGAPAQTATYTAARKQSPVWKCVAVLFSILTILGLIFSGMTIKYGVTGDYIPSGMDQLTSIKASSSFVTYDTSVLSTASTALSIAGMGMGMSTYGSYGSSSSYQNSQMEMINSIKSGVDSTVFWLNFYKILAAVVILLLVLSILLIVMNKRAGAALGVAGSAIMFIVNVVLVIVLFVLSGNLNNMLNQAMNSMGGSSGMNISLSLMPSVWLWISLPLSAITCILFAAKKQEITA